MSPGPGSLPGSSSGREDELGGRLRARSAAHRGSTCQSSPGEAAGLSPGVQACSGGGPAGAYVQAGLQGEQVEVVVPRAMASWTERWRRRDSGLDGLAPC